MNQKTIKIAGDTGGGLRRCPYCGSERIIGHALFDQSKQSVENNMSSLEIERKITTVLIECRNSQIRDLCNYMKRRSKRIPRHLSWREKAISAFKFMHNFLKAHLVLSEKSSKNWITVPVTPCMKARDL